MAKSSTVFRCSSCGKQVSKWLGQCPSCREWGTLAEVTTTRDALGAAGVKLAKHSWSSGAGLTATAAATPITKISAEQSRAVSTGISELDRVLGAGLVPGSVVLLAGEPGVGKSTLLLEVAHRCAAGELGPTLYISGEESVGQIRLRAERTNALAENLYLAAESELSEVIAQASEVNPGVLIVDSVQTLTAEGTEGTRGGVAQARAVTAALTSFAKASGTAVFLVGHVTKDGNVAGPRTMEHLVDVVLNFEGDRNSGLRFLRGLKNRFGTTDEVGCFEQTADGIREVTDPTGLFLYHRAPTVGTAVTVAMDGRRPLLAEIQGLTVASDGGKPRRNVSGLDSHRVPMVAAVLSEHGGIKALPSLELYVSTVGGMVLTEPAADLALGLAIASAVVKKMPSARTVALGEIGLAGEIRRIPDLQRRLREAARMGFKRALIPPNQIHSDQTRSNQPRSNQIRGMKDDLAGLELVEVATVADALTQFWH